MHEMIDMHSKYDNTYENGIFYDFICINNHIIVCINYILSIYNKMDLVFSMWDSSPFISCASHVAQ